MDLIEREKLIEILAEMQGRCVTKAALVQNSKIWQQVKDMPTVEAIPISWLEERAKDWLSVPEDSYCYEIAQRQAIKYLSVIERWRREQEE